MKPKCMAIIGANWGDEGKGSIVDWMASQTPEALIVRHSGGANAGHTVVADGKRHVFSHFGAGTLAGCRTYLSKFFISNPLLWHLELKELKEKDINPEPLLVDIDSPITTPIEISVNRMTEEARKAARHGSVGVGINETVTRENRGLKFRARHLLLGKDYLREALNSLYLSYESRLKELNATNEQSPFYISEGSWSDTRDQFIELCHEFTKSNSFTGVTPLSKEKYLIFEGSQGLGLDECRLDEFPHVTRARTGLTNVLWICERIGVDGITACYVTRTYATRHGAGRLDNELRELPEVLTPCSTNVENRWQGALRYAPLDFTDSLHRIYNDAIQAEDRDFAIQLMIAFTHCDQVAIYEEWVETVDSLGIEHIVISGGSSRESKKFLSKNSELQACGSD